LASDPVRRWPARSRLEGHYRWRQVSLRFPAPPEPGKPVTEKNVQFSLPSNLTSLAGACLAECVATPHPGGSDAFSMSARSVFAQCGGSKIRSRKIPETQRKRRAEELERKTGSSTNLAKFSACSRGSAILKQVGSMVLRNSARSSTPGKAEFYILDNSETLPLSLCWQV